MRETLQAHTDLSGPQINAICIEKLEKVYIASPAKRLEQYPHEFSGGMRQRIVIAISLLTSPNLIIVDEPTTALDVIIQAEIMDLLLELCETEQMGLLLISHDLSVIKHISNRVAVMYLGSLCELADTATLYQRPLHPYTRALLSAIPRLGGRFKHKKLSGDVPTPIQLPPGCVFHTRCDYARHRCRERYRRPWPCRTRLW